MLHDLAIGQYQLLADSDTRRIFPQGKDGKTRPITLANHGCGCGTSPTPVERMTSCFRDTCTNLAGSWATAE